MYFLKKFFLVFCLFLIPAAGYSQGNDLIGNTDKIIAVIGRNRIVLKSELEIQFAQIKQQDQRIHDTMKCQLLQQIIMQKLLVEQAERDSLLVSDEDVDGTLENKMRYFIRQFGSKEKLEEVAGKTVYQIKEENREVIREQMLAERMQGKILENIKITPSEINVFFSNIPVDSLPFYPATVEVGQIVMDPPVSEELDKYAKDELEKIRNKIINEGASFETQASINSDDPGSRNNGGLYTDVSRDGGFVKEFVAAAFKLQNGEISPVIKTQFGYHIIQMVQRKGDKVDIRHILKRPERVSGDFKRALSKLDSVRSMLIAGKITFPEAVGKYSTDEAAKQTGGNIVDENTGSAQLEVDKLDPGIILMIDSMKQGSFSQPQIYTNQRGEQSTRIVYLKSRTEPHKANLKDDYSKIQQIALSQKQSKKLEDWLQIKLPTYYIKLDPDYTGCRQFQNWNLAKAKD